MDRKEWDALGNPPGSFDAVLDMADANAAAKYVPLDTPPEAQQPRPNEAACGICGEAFDPPESCAFEDRPIRPWIHAYHRTAAVPPASEGESDRAIEEAFDRESERKMAEGYNGDDR